MFLFLASTTMTGEGTWYVDTVPVLMWFMVIGKDMQQIILSVNNWYCKGNNKFNGHFFHKETNKI